MGTFKSDASDKVLENTKNSEHRTLPVALMQCLASSVPSQPIGSQQSSRGTNIANAERRKISSRLQVVPQSAVAQHKGMSRCRFRGGGPITKELFNNTPPPDD
eukprot:1937316-Amphidinium_carterae.1